MLNASLQCGCYILANPMRRRRQCNETLFDDELCHHDVTDLTGQSVLETSSQECCACGFVRVLYVHAVVLSVCSCFGWTLRAVFLLSTI